MKTVQLIKRKDTQWTYITPPLKLINPLVLVFGDRLFLEDLEIYNNIKKIFPTGHIVFASTSGNFLNNTIEDNCLTITAIEFEKTIFNVEKINLTDTSLDSYKAGASLVKKLNAIDLKYILILSNGSFINGSELINGMNDHVKSNVIITGGLSSDGNSFKRTLVSYNENPKDGELVAIGFYGDTFEVTTTSQSGWEPFGLTRKVTKSKSNILYEIDNKPAIDLYKKYLGDKASLLPGIALYYPLQIILKDEEHPKTSTILNIDMQYNAMIFAGEIPSNCEVRLMMSSTESLLNAAQKATEDALNQAINKPQLALVVSGSGRKLIMEQRVNEELSQIKNTLKNEITICGFYSYGEIAPYYEENRCQLHNQSIAVTLISE